MSIGDTSIRGIAAMNVVQQVAMRDPAAARQLIDAPQVPPGLKSRLEAALQSSGRVPR